MLFFPAQARVARLQAYAAAGPKIVLAPPRSIFMFVDHYAVYTHCIGRMHSLATTSGPARKVGVVSIIKMAGLEQTLHNLSSSKIK